MLSRDFSFWRPARRLASSVGLVLVMGAVALACKAKGNGVGTAPGDVPCPAVRPVAASPCPIAPDGGVPPGTVHVGDETTICRYAGTCGDDKAEGEVFLFCPGGTNAAWKCIEATDGGTSDASIDAGDAADGETSDAADADETSDAADASDASDSSETADDASDAGDSSSDASESGLDVGPSD